MNRAEALELLQSALARIAVFRPEAAMFVRDDKVNYASTDEILVARSDLAHLAADEDWRPFLDGPQGWLHANLMEAPDGTQVVSLQAGPPAEGPRRQVAGHTLNLNASVERRPLRIID